MTMTDPIADMLTAGLSEGPRAVTTPSSQPRTLRARVRGDDHAGAPDPLLGAERHAYTDREHRRRSEARWRVRAHDGQRAQRRPLHDASGLHRPRPAPVP